MGFFCRCKKCGADFVDTYGEYVEDGCPVCPRCKSREILVDEDIPEDPPFKPIDFLGIWPK